MHVRRNVCWTIGVGGTCLVFFILLPLLLRHDGKSPPITSPSPGGAGRLDSQKYQATQSLAVPSNKSVPNEERLSEPPVLSQEVPPPDDRALEIHRAAAAALNAKSREATKRFY